MQEVRGAGIKRGCETLDLGKGEPWRVDASWGGGVFSSEKGGRRLLGAVEAGTGRAGRGAFAQSQRPVVPATGTD